MKNLFLILLITITSNVFAIRIQISDSIPIYESNLPEGVYKTKRDFINRKPTSKRKLIAKQIGGIKKLVLKRIDASCHFYTKESNKRLRNNFSVVYNGELFFRIDDIKKNRRLGFSNLYSNFPNAYVKVVSGGHNFYYAEIDYLERPRITSTLNSININLNKSKKSYLGFVFDKKELDFVLLFKCKDAKKFNSNIHCLKRSLKIEEIRKVIEKIK